MRDPLHSRQVVSGLGTECFAEPRGVGVNRVSLVRFSTNEEREMLDVLIGEEPQSTFTIIISAFCVVVTDLIWRS